MTTTVRTRLERESRSPAYGGHTSHLCLFASCVLTTFAVAVPAEEPLQRAIATLETTRDKLAVELETRIQADRAKENPLDCFWLLPGGADGDDMWMIIRRRGGKWFAGEARVPYWRQETQGEKFSFQHRDGGQSNDRDKFLHAVDADRLAWDGNRVTGKAVVAFQRDRTMDEMLPPGGRSFMTAQGRWSLLDQWGTILHRRTRLQTYTFDVTVRTNTCYLQLVIDQGISGSPVLVDGQLPSSRWLPPHVTTPRFNAGYHEAWLEGLKQEGGRLKGDIRAKINPDVYWPRESIDVTYTVDAEIQDGCLRGTFNAQVTALKDVHEAITGQRYGNVGSWKGPKTFSGTVSGFIYQGVEGRFTATGELGVSEGPVRGGVLCPAKSTREILSVMPSPQGVATAASVYQQIRALRLALDRYPLPLSDTLADVNMPFPAVPDDMQTSLAERLGRIVEVGAVPSPVTGYVRPDDVTFGPYYGVQNLDERDSAAQWPADATAAKNQRWCSITSWSVIGPFPQNRTLDGETPSMPDLIAVPGATYSPPQGLPANVFSNNLTWSAVTSTYGRISVPRWTKSGKGSRPGWPDTRWYAASRIDMPADTETWIAIETMDHGALWINDRLVWVAVEREHMNSDRGPAVFRTTLRKGRNDFLVRCRDDRATSWFSVAICTHGEPAAKPVVAETQPPVEIPGQPGINGFSFPSATPPLAWDADKGINVLWRWHGTNLSKVGITMVGSGGGGSPVAADDSPGKLIVVGDRVLMNMEPHILLCLDAATGQPVWTRESSVFECLGGEAQKAWTAATDTVSQLTVFTSRVDAVGVKITGYGRLASATPVSDGKRVFVHYGTGVTAAYDLDGKRLWMAQTRVGAGSLILASKSVILSGAPLNGWKEKNVSEGSATGAFHAVMAFDPEAGRPRWSTAARGNYAMSAFRVDCGGREIMVTRNGEVLDTTNGKTCGPEISPDFGTPFKWTGMYQHNNRFFMVEEDGETRFDILVDPQGQVGWKHNWVSRRLYSFVAGGPNVGIALDNSLAVWRRPQEFAKHNPQYSLGLDVYGTTDGVHSLRLSRILTNTNVPLPPARGGDYLFLADYRGGSHTTFSARPAEERMVAVVKLTPQPYVVARNPTPRLSATPVPAGSRLFIRCGDELVAIAVNGDAGKRYQESTVAQTVLGDTAPPPVGIGTPRALDALPGRPHADVPVMPAGGRLMDWLVAGPFPGQTPGIESPLTAKRIDDVPAVGVDLTIGTVKRTFASLPADAQDALTRFVNDGQLDDWQLRSLDRAILVDKLRLTKPDDMYVFSAVLDNARDRVVCATAEAPGVETFLDGVLAAPGVPFLLKHGLHHAMLRVRPGHYRNPVFAATVNVPQAMASNALQDIHWPVEWTVFGPAAETMSPPASANMKQIPESLALDGTLIARKVLKAEDKKVNLVQLLQNSDDPKIDPSSVAYAYSDVECPEDGHFVVNASADWFMEWFVDGDQVYSTLLTGNRGDTDAVTGHTFVRQVKKGRHTLVVKVKPGSRGWSFMSLGGFTAGSPIEVAQRFAPGGVVPAEKVIRVTPGLAFMDDPAAVAATWRERVRIRKAAIEEVAKSQYPELAKQAQTILKQAGL